MTQTTTGSVAPAAEPVHPDWSPGPGVRIVFNLVLIAVGSVYLVQALALEQWSVQGPRAGFFPVVAASLFLFCMAFDTIRLLVQWRRRTGPVAVGTFNWKVAAVLGSILGYVLLANVLGHIITAFLVVVALLHMLGKRPWWQIVLTALIAAVGSDYLFTELLGLSLTSGLTGIGFDEWI